MKQAPSALRFAAVAVDVAIFGIRDGGLHVLIGAVDRPPHYVHVEALVGGLIAVDETAEEAVKRHLKEKVGLAQVYTEQLFTFSALDRDKRNRVISIANIGLVRPKTMDQVLPEGFQWCPVREVPSLAYDHDEILRVALTRLKSKLLYTNIAQFLLPVECTLTDLQDVYESILGTTLDKRNFRKKIGAIGMLTETGERQAGVRNRPAMLHRFTSQKLTEYSLMG